MILVKGQVYYTIIDLAKQIGVSAKTIREYLRKGIIPEPPLIEYGMRSIKYFPSEYMDIAKKSVKMHREKKKAKPKGVPRPGK